MNKFIHGFLSAAAAAVFCFITVFTGYAPPPDGPDSAAVVSYCIAGRSREVDGGKVSYDKITVARYIYIAGNSNIRPNIRPVKGMDF